jgi:hypothetical protein
MQPTCSRSCITLVQRTKVMWGWTGVMALYSYAQLPMWANRQARKPRARLGLADTTSVFKRTPVQRFGRQGFCRVQEEVEQERRSRHCGVPQTSSCRCTTRRSTLRPNCSVNGPRVTPRLRNRRNNTQEQGMLRKSGPSTSHRSSNWPREKAKSRKAQSEDES